MFRDGETNLCNFLKCQLVFCNLENANVDTGLGSHGVTAAAQRYKGHYFRDVGANEQVDLQFLCALGCLSLRGSERHRGLVVICSCTFFLLMGVHAKASASLNRNMHTCTHTHSRWWYCCRWDLLIPIFSPINLMINLQSKCPYAVGDKISVRSRNTVFNQQRNSLCQWQLRRTANKPNRLLFVPRMKDYFLLQQQNITSHGHKRCELRSHRLASWVMWNPTHCFSFHDEVGLWLETQQTVTLDPVVSSLGRSIKHNLKDVKTILRGRD